MDPAEQGDHTAPTDHHSQDRSSPTLRPHQQSPSDHHPLPHHLPHHPHLSHHSHRHSHLSHHQQPHSQHLSSHTRPHQHSHPLSHSHPHPHQHSQQSNPHSQSHSHSHSHQPRSHQPSHAHHHPQRLPQQSPQPQPQPQQPHHQSQQPQPQHPPPVQLHHPQHRHHSPIPVSQQLSPLRHLPVHSPGPPADPASHVPALHHNPHLPHHRASSHHIPPSPHHPHHHTTVQTPPPQPAHQPAPVIPSPHAPPPDRQPIFRDQLPHRRQMHMQIHHQTLPHQSHQSHHITQSHVHAQPQQHPSIDSRQDFEHPSNVMMGIQPQPSHHHVTPSPHTAISRTPSSLIHPGAHTSAAVTAAEMAQCSSTAKLWSHFVKGEKMQKTNKFYAHCIYCRKVNRDSATRGERRMMSAHLSTCSEAPEEARAEGLAISKELKIRRSITGIDRKNRLRSVGPGGPIGGIGGVNMAAVAKRVRRSVPSLHAAVAQSASASSQDAMVAAAAAAAAATAEHGAPPQTDATGSASAPYFDPGMESSMGLAPEMIRSGQATTSDNVRLYYEDAGSGHPLILIHGLSGSCKYFDANFRDLSSRFRVIRFDLRGHGDSEKPQYGFHVHRLAADLHDLMDHFSFERVALLGCSLGCAVIWAFVELYGVSQISAAMFVDQSPFQMASPDGLWKLGSKHIFSEGSLAHVCSELTKNPRAFHEEAVRAGFTRTPTAMEITTFVNESLKSAVWFTSKLMANHSYMDWRSVLPLVSCPALVIAGKKSKVFPWEGVAYAAQNMPHAKLIPFEEGSHWLYIEESVRFNSTVAAFLQSIVAGT